MQKVLGLGGLFFRADDPATLAEWYETRLGVSRVPDNYDAPSWRQEAGDTVFAPFKRDTDYFGDLRRQWMVNFRVADLNAMVLQLQTLGETVEVDPERYPNGRFARLADPEGNPVQLWQPMGPE